MNISLPASQQQMIANYIASQGYSDEVDVISTALALLEQKTAFDAQHKEALHSAIAQGVAQADAGEFAADDDIDTIFAELHAKEE